APVAIETEHWSLGIFFGRALDFRPNAEPIAHGHDLAERNTGLGHAERARIHSEKDHPLWVVAVTAQIKFMRVPGVIERVVNMGDRRGKLQFADRGAETSRSCDQ